MSTKIANRGWVTVGAGTKYPLDMRRNALATSDGRMIAVVGDGNSSSASSGYGDRNDAGKVYVYESTDRSAWTLRATITPGVALDSPHMVMAELFSDNSIGVVYKCTQSWRYRKVTTGTWAVSAEETIVGSVSWTTSGSWVDGDLTIGNADVPSFIGAYKGNTNGDYYGYRVYTRRTSDSTWVQSATNSQMTSNNLKNNTHDITIASLDGGSATSRPVVVAVGNAGDSTDFGVKLHTWVLNESTGALTGMTLRNSFMQDEFQTSGMSWSNRPRKSFLFRSGTNEFFLGIMTYRAKTGKKPKFFAYMGSWNASSYSQVIAAATFSVPTSILAGGDSMAMTFGSDVANYVTGINDGTASYNQITNGVCRVNRTSSTFDFSGLFKYNNNSDSYNTKYVMGGSGRNYNRKDHDIVYGLQVSTTKWELWHHYAKVPRVPFSVTPSGGATITSSTPAISLLADLDLKWPQSRIKARWQIANDASFTVNLKDYTQPDSKYIEVKNTNVTGSYQTIKDTLPTLYTLSGGNWWIKGYHVDEFGHTSGSTVAATFVIAHPPVATNMRPDGINRIYTTGDVTYQWDFSDPFDLDSQTAFQVVVMRDDTGAIIHDSGKVTSTATSYTANHSGYQEVPLNWYVVLWDEDDTQGPVPAFASYTNVVAPTIVFTAPTSGGTVTTPMPQVAFNGVVQAGRTLKQYRVIFSEGTNLIFQSPWITSIQSGSYSVVYVPPQQYLLNTHTYTVTVRVRDSINLEPSASLSFTVSYTPPANPTPVTVNIVPYNQENAGYVQVTWDNSDIDVDFRSWNIYRKDDELDGTGAVVEQGVFVKLFEEFDVVGAYEFRDYFAPAGHKVTYMVTQVADRFEALLESSGTQVVSYPVSDGYWLIDPTPETSTAGAFRLRIVTADDYTDEWEESDFVVVGRGRHVDRGTHLGLNGSLTVELRDDGGTTARQKKRRLELFKEEVRDVFMRTPFGDTYWVSVGNLQIGRLAGVGTSEYATATIPYKEIGVT